MKTSTKIFIAVLACLVAMCIVDIFVAQAEYKKYDPAARRLAQQLDVTEIRVLDISTTNVPMLIDKGRFLRRGMDFRRVSIGANAFENIRFSGDTMYIENYSDEYTLWPMFTSSELETVVIHRAGMPDEVFDYREEESD